MVSSWEPSETTTISISGNSEVEAGTGMLPTMLDLFRHGLEPQDGHGLVDVPPQQVVQATRGELAAKMTTTARSPTAEEQRVEDVQVEKETRGGRTGSRGAGFSSWARKLLWRDGRRPGQPSASSRSWIRPSHGRPCRVRLGGPLDGGERCRDFPEGAVSDAAAARRTHQEASSSGRQVSSRAQCGLGRWGTRPRWRPGPARSRPRRRRRPAAVALAAPRGTDLRRRRQRSGACCRSSGRAGCWRRAASSAMSARHRGA